MDRILIIMKRKKDTRASSVPLMWLFSIIFKHVYWYIQHISGERLHTGPLVLWFMYPNMAKHIDMCIAMYCLIPGSSLF